MAHSHSHAHRHGPSSVDVARGPVTVLLTFLALTAVATVIGVVALWPDAHAVDTLRNQAQYAAPGVTFQKARVTAVQKPCPPDQGQGDPNTSGSSASCGQIAAVLTDGPELGATEKVGVPTAVAQSGLAAGDHVRLVRIPGTNGAPATYSFDDVIRLKPLWLLAALFVLVVAAVARLRGVLALVSLGIGGAVLFKFMLPALLSGSSGVAVALVGSAAIMFVVLYLAHGPSIRTSAALAGTLLGVGVTAAVGQLAIHGATLSGFGDESAGLLSAFADNLSFQGLLTCALVVAGLGVLNDVTITQASAVWELREAGPDLSRRTLFTSAMRIGRDHIASTIYTIVFAYAGSALAVLLLLSLYDRPLVELLSSESISEEIVRTLASGIGLVLAVPITTAIAALTVVGPRSAPADR
ncbi:YibE/F family protein [Nocardioides marmorisolisilvae]|uniref:YibE/F family protein n=1 Tax=Nocardioides marmorisolisilvae TaxID=1542737 RepID=A0A3N0DI65_9ACTN|nr:YibE/F family protein [Nocardioides marmorisolisilvae]RNL75345.1 YibE/F family protein [Nocardioides marmorisolisilvae]